MDARQPNPVNDLVPHQGIQYIIVNGPQGINSACFSMCETASYPGDPNAIADVSANDSTYTIALARPITPGAVTRIAYNPCGGPPQVATFIFHPSNVNGDSTAAPVDVISIINCLNGLPPKENCPWGIHSMDIDQSGVFGPSDILRVIDLLNGADVYDPWINTPLPNGTCTP